jgi:hypothetical protein
MALFNWAKHNYVLDAESKLKSELSTYIFMTIWYYKDSLLLLHKRGTVQMFVSAVPNQNHVHKKKIKNVLNTGNIF